MNTQEFYQMYVSNPAFRLEVQQAAPDMAKQLDALVAQQPQMAQQAPQQAPATGGPSLGSMVSTAAKEFLPDLFGGSSSSAGAAAPTQVGSAPGIGGLPGKLMSDGTTATDFGSVGLNTQLGNLGTIGSGLGLAGMAYQVGDNFLSNGGGDLVKHGKVDRRTVTDAVLDSNPVTFWMNPLAKMFGGNSIGGMFQGPSMKERNKMKAQSLLDKGTNMHFNDTSTMFDTANKQGKVDDRVAADFTGMNEGEWINNKFAESRNVADLRPEDVWGALDVYDTLGNDYLGTTSEDQRRQFQQRALDEGLFYEGKGRVRIKDENRDRYKQLFEEVRSGAPQQGRPQAYTPDRTNPMGPPVQQSGMRDMMYWEERDGPKAEAQNGYGSYQHFTQGLPDPGPNTKPMVNSPFYGGTTMMAAINKPVGNAVSNRYGADVAKQVQAAQTAGRNVGTGGAGMVWDGSNFVRR